MFGYTFSKEERGRLTVKDPCFLKTFSELSIEQAVKCPVNKNCIAGTDQKLRGWNQNTFHGLLEYDFGYHFSNPGVRVSFEYAYPLTGKRYWWTDVWCGTGAVQVDWMW